jgi:hypothetical protein
LGHNPPKAGLKVADRKSTKAATVPIFTNDFIIISFDEDVIKKKKGS